MNYTKGDIAKQVQNKLAVLIKPVGICFSNLERFGQKTPFLSAMYPFSNIKQVSLELISKQVKPK